MHAPPAGIGAAGRHAFGEQGAKRGQEKAGLGNSPKTILEHADFIGGTEAMIKHVGAVAEPTTFIVATEIGIFTQALPERYLRLEGINTAQGNAKVLVELYRVAFDPLKEISFISDEYNKFELEGSLLADTTKPFDTVLGQFGRIVQL